MQVFIRVRVIIYYPAACGPKAHGSRGVHSLPAEFRNSRNFAPKKPPNLGITPAF